jgi:hypothetical protein
MAKDEGLHLHLQGGCPRLAALITAADTNRATRLAVYGGGATLRGIDEALAYLHQAISAFEQDVRLKRLRQLVGRALAELDTAVLAFLAGLNGVVFDSMRAAMEIEFLLRDFLLWPSHLDEWIEWDAKERRRKFGPATLRARYQQRQDVTSKESQEAKDYALHSECLHVSPIENPNGRPGVTTDDHPGQSRVCLAEITSHAGRIITLVHRHWQNIPLDVPLTRETAPRLPHFEDAWSRSQLGVVMWWPLHNDS